MLVRRKHTLDPGRLHGPEGLTDARADPDRHLPLVGFLINGLAGNRLGQKAVSVIGCGLPIVSFAITIAMFMALMQSGEPRIDIAYTWATVGKTNFEIALYFDRLSAVMTLIVTGVGGLIHIYSVGYMRRTPGSRGTSRT